MIQKSALLSLAGAVLAALLIQTPARADAVPAEIVKIRAIYEQCQAIRLVKTSPKAHAVAVYTDGDYTKDPKWVKAAPRDAEVMSEVTAFRSDGMIRSATLFETSPSGDWAQTFDYCYRKDGTLAFILAELRTFRGNVRVVDRLYYGPTGVEIRRVRKYFDLDTNKPVTGKTPQFQDLEIRVLKTADALARYAKPALD